MKTRVIIISLFVAAISCTTEMPENNLGMPTISDTQAKVEKTTRYISLCADVTRPKLIKTAGFYVSDNVSMSGAEKILAASVSDKITAEYLPQGYGKTYYYKAFISNGVNERCSDIATFKSESLGYYVNLVSAIESMAETYATVSASLTVAEGINLTSKGFCYGEKENVTIEDNVVEVTSSEFKAVVPCSEGTYIRAYVRDGDEVAYSSVATKVTIPDIVDLGLSVKWASFNVGASKPEEYGNYYAWGEIETKSVYNWANLKYCIYGDDIENARFSKYVTNVKYGMVDDKVLLDSSDDAARSIWGDGWRMPTEAEFKELIDNCVWTWIIEGTFVGAKSGYEVKSKSNGTSIFLPAAGWYDDKAQCTIFECRYWSRSLDKTISSEAVSLYGCAPSMAGNDDYHDLTSIRRCVGFAVRPVTE